VKKKLFPLILGVFFLFLIINNLDWLRLDQYIPIDDESAHIYNSYFFYHRLSRGDIENFFLERLYSYPPLVYQVSSLFYHILPPHPDSAVISQFPFQAILIFSIYLIGKYLWSEEVGLLAAVASFGFPYMTIMSHSYLLDLPCAAIVALSILFLLYSGTFRNSSWTFAFFVASALAVLTKWSSIFFIFPVFIVYFAMFIRNIFKEKKSPWLTLAMLAIIIALSFLRVNWLYNEIRDAPVVDNRWGDIYWESVSPLIILFIITFFIPFKSRCPKSFVQGFFLFIILTWHSYGLKFFDYLEYFDLVTEAGMVEGDGYSIIKFLEKYILQVQWLPWVIFLIIGLAWYLFTKDKTRDRTVFMVGFIASLITLFLIQDKEPRYFIPTITFSSVIMTFWIFQIKWKTVRMSLSILLLSLAVLGIMGWRFTPLNKRVQEFKGLYCYHYPVIAPAPRTMNWKLDRVIEVLEKDLEDGSAVILIAMEGEAETLSSPNFLIEALNRNSQRHVSMPLKIGGLKGDGFSDIQQKRFKFFFASDYEGSDNFFNSLIVLYYEDLSLRGKRKINYMKILNNRHLHGELNKEESITISDNIILHIMRREIEPPCSIWELEHLWREL